MASLGACGRTPVYEWASGGDPGGGASDDEVLPGGWLLTIDTNAYELLRVDVADGSTERLCSLEADGARYTSSAFDASGRLFVTYKVEDSDTSPDRLARLDPCSCDKEPIADYGYGGAAGLAFGGDTLYALSHAADALLELDPDTGAVTSIGSTGVDIRNHGASWSDAEQAVLVLEGSQDRLFRLEVETGRAEVLADFAFDFSTVGFEVLPQTGRMYACTGDAVLYAVEPADGSVDEIGPLDQTGNCGNLAAARGPVACVSG